MTGFAYASSDFGEAHARLDRLEQLYCLESSDDATWSQIETMSSSALRFLDMAIDETEQGRH